jgi:prophage regulatory protein
MIDVGERLIGLPEVRRKTGLGTSSIYRKMSAAEFPAARRKGVNSVGWKLSEIDEWINNLPKVKVAS